MYQKTGKLVVGKDASSPQWREERRTYLAELIQTNPHQYWSARKLSKAAREHPVIGMIQPNYGHMTAWRDWAVIQEELRAKREEIATEYIDAQLEVTDTLLEDLMDEYQALEVIDFNEIEKPEARIAMQLRVAGTKKRLVEAMDKLLYRQQTLLPMAVPKQVQVDQKSVSMTLDQLLAAKKEALKAIEPENMEVIEGEVISDNGSYS